MPQSPTPRRCNDCDGFPVVAITTGTRTPDGQRTTLPVTCRTCHGTGTHTPTTAGRLARVAR
ncbi:hypothetical protein POF50_019405 [Streptomyces sp. SL13]|uniref:Uncharacterized protein n=1 Tax=Streptantibioticus silvisoli TaxID=2705255 RepID=A0AA90K9Q2_9ACTN|nr:hypothetical protein [Streptantibioticus silvisoli]MDI5971473.1 hypothetical protein [Streptantibioticus silvisoli]